MLKDNIKIAAQMINNSSNTWVLTGAGMSTESGIPDFRTPNSGLWEKIDPMEALSRNVLYNNPTKFYKTGYCILTQMSDFQPNEGHVVLAKLEEKGYINGIITQNIDNLHIRAGSKNVLEVHGNTRTGSCTDCNYKVELKYLTKKIQNNEIPPKCEQCGSSLRPDVVLFGDQLPKEFDKAWEIVNECELLIVIGSSLTVSPVNYLPQISPKVIIINLDKTHYDSYADIVIRGKAGTVLNKIFNSIQMENNL